MTSWNEQSKNIASWNEQSKNTASWSEQSKSDPVLLELELMIDDTYELLIDSNYELLIQAAEPGTSWSETAKS